MSKFLGSIPSDQTHVPNGEPYEKVNHKIKRAIKSSEPFKRERRIE